MRKLLLDTHTLIWFLEEDARLPAKNLALIKNRENRVNVSIVCFWEIAIKKGLSKLEILKSVDEMHEECARLNIQILNISIAEISLVEALPLHHRDPFDRIMVATSIVQNFEIISADTAFDSYPVKRIW